MDRIITHVGAVPRSVDILSTNKNLMVAMGYLMRSVLGTSLSVDGLACTPNSPADLTVKVGPGSIHKLENVDGTAYGVIDADTTNQIMKQGLAEAPQSFSCPAPTTTGHSRVYLIQAAYQDQDAGAAVLPYYNASNPSVPWSGPNNTGVSQNTVRKGVCLLGVKAGISATTGTQATPAPDAGYVGLYAITVAHGQTAINSGDIQRLATAPFIGTKLPEVLTAIQQGKASFAVDTSGAANTITVALDPVPAGLTDGMRVFVKVANTVTGPTVMDVNGGGNVAVVTTSGAALPSGAMEANGIYPFVYDANGTRWQLQGYTAPASSVPPGTIHEFAGITPPSDYLWAAGQAVSRTTYAALFAALTATCTGNTSNGSPTISSVSVDFTALGLVGAKVEGTGIPAGTTINAVTSSTITLSANATATGTGVSLRLLPHGTGDGSTTFNVPDKRGRVGAGRDDMNGTAASRLTSGVSGVTGTSLGAAGGSQQMQQHTHTASASDSGHDHSYLQVAGGGSGQTTGGASSYSASASTGTGYANISVTVNNAGSGSSQNVQPTIVLNHIIKT